MDGSTFFEIVQKFYDTTVFTYGTGLLTLYAVLAILSYKNINIFNRKESYSDYSMIVSSPLAPGVSIIAPAFNEGVTIIDNVRSLLTIDYPKFEVVIINDGSTDDTLEKLINEFSLVKVDYAYNPILSTKPVKDIYKSTNDAYAKLVVVDKENGKSKADASNAGINVCNYPYFVCTDVDCILHEAVLQKLIKPIMEDDKFRVIATGATLRLSNSCEVDGGVITKIRAPKGLISCFQELEYIRAFVLGKMGWSYINAVPNVSGGLGMFDKEIAIKSGGYDPLSFGEDMELLMRMNRYVHENKIISAVKYVPVTLCWTEGPSTLKVFMRQRTRWARGLFQLMVVHRNVFFNPKYGKLGMIVYPYSFFFELIAPIIEFTGVLYYIYIIITNQINWGYAVILLIFVYTYSVMISTIAVLWDQITFKYYKVPSDVLRLCLMVFVEMLLYHPLIVIFSLRGYFFYLTNQKHVWGAMTRKGFQKSQSASATPATA